MKIELLTLAALALLGCEEGPPPVVTFGGGASVPSPVAALTLSGANQVGVGLTAMLEAEALDDDGQPVATLVTWISGDPSLLYVDDRGGLVGLRPGGTTITAKAGGAESAPLAITVRPADPPTVPFNQVLPIFQQSCAVSGCHVDGVEPGDLRFDRDPEDVEEELLDDDAEQTGQPRVTRGRPEASYLIEKLSNPIPAVGARMPFGRAPLPADQMAKIVRWVLGG